ncbi:hypothetical protein CKA32_002605 [Geitlerinema sp. FC II]|nr:hypothetical protein CKA32_002605 [Geitlerinema sp. FC II]
MAALSERRLQVDGELPNSTFGDRAAKSSTSRSRSDRSLKFSLTNASIARSRLFLPG